MDVTMEFAREPWVQVLLGLSEPVVPTDVVVPGMARDLFSDEEAV